MTNQDYKVEANFKEKKDSWYQEFSNNLINQIETNTAPWQKPWQAGEYALPYNSVTGKAYKGINSFHLSNKDFADPRYLTFNQAAERGYKISKGAKSERIVFYKYTDNIILKDENGQALKDENGKKLTQVTQLEKPVLKFYNVFNAGHIEGIEPYNKEVHSWRESKDLDTYINALGLNIFHDQRDRAYYSATNNTIHMPEKSSFTNEGEYYATLLHEISHQIHIKTVGSEAGSKKSESYAREELVAEISSYLLCAEFNLPFNPQNTHAYLQGYLGALKDDKFEIVRAVKEADKVVNFFIKQEVKQEQAILTVVQLKTDVDTKLFVPFEEKTQARELGCLWNEAQKHWYLPANVEARLPEKWLEAEKRLYLHVPLEEKEKAKELGANWDKEKFCWYIVTNKGLDDKIPNEWLTKPKNIYLNVPREEKDLAKELGANFDSKNQKWFLAPNADLSNLPSKWLEPDQRIYLFVPKENKDIVKEMGAKFDVYKSQWYLEQGADTSKLAKEWLEKTSLSPQEEFAEVIKNAGIKIDGLPIMDGKIHRVPVEKKNSNNFDGTYKGYLDGRPSGYYKNFVTGEETNWKYTGHTLSPEQITRAVEQNKVNKEAEDLEREKMYEHSAKKAYAIWVNNKNYANSNNYLQKKGVSNYGVKQDEKGNLLVPGYDIKTGRIQTILTVTQQGKFFMKGSQVKGAVHIIGSKEEFAKSTIIIAEGYATAATIHEASNLPVVCAFNSGNLMSVAQEYREKYPNLAIAICADNDHKLDKNVGLEKALEVARAVEAKVYCPQGIEGTDFNDLMQEKGIEAVQKQLPKNEILTTTKQAPDKSYESAKAFLEAKKKQELGR